MQPTLLTIFLSAYGLVFIAEIVGDKLLYTTGILAARYRVATVVVGVLFAFMIKMGVAVSVAGLVSRLPRDVVAAITAVNFVAIAFVLWRKPDVKPDKKKKKDPHSTSQGVLVSFAAVFFSEWGDIGQITCATVALKFSGELAQAHATVGLLRGALIAVWLGAVSAMMTKGALAATAGAGVRAWVQERIAPKTVRYAAVSLLLVVGSLSVLEILGYLPG